MAKRASKLSPRDAPVIATRTLEVAGSRRKAVVTVRMPVQVGEDEWQCDVRITGARRVLRGHGVDAVQALYGALDRARIELNAAKRRYAWLGTDEHGFAQVAPYGVGARFARRLERVMDRELVGFVRAEAQKRRRRRRGKKQ